ncbi:hypothetical protein VN97_g3013 [Penicillium thymicola]|uniref:Uncharacterized protein n=1 Tax=Penicillium thymicola TaxID=293382 RepID=A0AAI9TN32_PENTH|nr:hypothetical protein VN97_g3013 [Penicillium thymicola]
MKLPPSCLAIMRNESIALRDLREENTTRTNLCFHTYRRNTISYYFNPTLTTIFPYLSLFSKRFGLLKTDIFEL